MFLPDTKVILDRRVRPDGIAVWNVEDDDTYQVQVASWYDNENSYTSQMVRTIKYFAENC